jgi:hypothetical protein
MERHEQQLDAWVHERMTAGGRSSPPAEWPDDQDGWRRLEQRFTRPRRTLPRLTLPRRRAWVWAAAATMALAAVVALPATRKAAQRLWDEVFVGRIELVSTDFERGAVAHIFSPEFRLRPEPTAVASLEEAGNTAGFWPRLPAAGVFASQPTFSVTDVGLAALPLDVTAIRALAERAGIPASEVPDSWKDGMLELRVGPIIVADYNGVLLLQSLPFQLKTPADFNLELFYRIAFRSLGMSEAEARALSVDAAMSPAYLTLAPKEEQELFTKFKTKTGSGVMISEVYGPGKVAALWSGVDRVYALFPAEGEITREFVVKVANSVE